MPVTILHPAPAERLQNLRAHLASPTLAPSLRAACERRVTELERELLQAPGSLDAVAPALEKWRREVLANKHARPLEQAAAWELTALECERFGCQDEARAARRFAATAICQP